MKKNNLLKTVLLFLFAVLLLQGCRSENIMDTNKSEYTYTHIVSKEVKSLKDVPIFKAFIDDNKNEGQLKSLSKKISGENNIVVIIKKPNRVSYSTIILSGKNSFTILVYCIDDKNNKNAFLAEHNSKNELKEINLNNFTGNIFYKKMNGESLGKINMINGQPEITSRNTKTSTVDCYYEPTLTAIRCTAGGNHYPGQVCGGTADQQPYWDVSFSLKCQQTQDQLYNDIGGGDYGSGSNPALTLFGADAINYMLSQIGMTHLNPDQYSFLTSHPTIADYFKTFFWGGNQNIDGANFLYWGINFFMQNSNTTIEQFQNWFIDYAPDNFISEIVKHDPKTILEYDAISPSFTMRKLDQIKYPRFTLLLKTLRSKIEQNPTMINRLSKLSGLTNAQVLEKLTFGKGPLINIVPNLLGPSGPNYGNFDSTIPNQININANFVLGLEKSVLNTTIEATAFLLAVTVLHEFIHYGNHLTGYNTLGQEMGNLFEIDSYGIIITKYNASQYIISLNNK